MSVLCVHLQDGFDGDLVIIRMNGAEWARRPNVMTQPFLGHAEFVDLPKLTEGNIRLDVSLPKRGLDQSATVPGIGNTFVAANVEDGWLQLSISNQLRGCM
jgi:hypothetical protein